MNQAQEVVLKLAVPADADALSNLVQLYAYDFSETYSLELGANGRFPYDKLPLYWSQPEHRFPFLIHHGNVMAGFVLATRGSPASDDPHVFDVAEFFVLRRHRRFGVGRRAAFRLWDAYPASWTVRVSDANAAGQSFWSRIIMEYLGGSAAETSMPGNPRPMRVFTFNSTKQTDAKVARQ
jgi:predicted acetyltransferase